MKLEGRNARILIVAVAALAMATLAYRFADGEKDAPETLESCLRAAVLAEDSESIARATELAASYRSLVDGSLGANMSRARHVIAHERGDKIMGQAITACERRFVSRIPLVETTLVVKDENGNGVADVEVQRIGEHARACDKPTDRTGVCRLVLENVTPSNPVKLWLWSRSHQLGESGKYDFQALLSGLELRARERTTRAIDLVVSRGSKTEEGARVRVTGGLWNEDCDRQGNPRPRECRQATTDRSGTAVFYYDPEHISEGDPPTARVGEYSTVYTADLPLRGSWKIDVEPPPVVSPRGPPSCVNDRVRVQFKARVERLPLSSGTRVEATVGRDGRITDVRGAGNHTSTLQGTTVQDIPDRCAPGQVSATKT